MLRNYAFKPAAQRNGPKGLPFLGLIPFLAKDRFSVFHEATKIFGDHVDLGKQGENHYFLTSDPEITYECLVSQASSFVKSPNYKKLTPLTGEGLLLLEGKKWKNHRKMIAPQFHPSHLAKFKVAMLDTVHDYLDHNPEFDSGERFDLGEKMHYLALDVVCQTLLGSWATPQEKKHLVFHLNEVLTHISSVFYKNPFMELLGRKTAELQLESGGKEVDRVARQIYARVKKAPHVEGDFLIDLIHGGLDADDFCAEFKTLVFAGHETSANALSWFWWYILQGKNRSILDELQASVKDLPTDVDLRTLRKNQLLIRCIEETLRLCPSAPSVSRIATEDVKIGDTQIKKGEVYIYLIIEMHRNKDFWPDPMRWDPKRFDSQPIGHPKNKVFLPFAAGPRNCVGSGFAMMEMMYIIFTMIQRLDLQLDEATVPREQYTLTLKPSGVFTTSRFTHRHKQ